MSATTDIKIYDNGVEKRYYNIDELRIKDAEGNVKIWIPEKAYKDVAGIQIVQNGTYKAADKNLFGFTSATINVPVAPPYILGVDTKEEGGGETVDYDAILAVDDDGNLWEKEFTFEKEVEDIDPVTGEKEKYLMGTDKDGNEVMIAVDKETGKIIFNPGGGGAVERLAPESIDLVKAPDKRTYNTGENFDLTGSIVKALNGKHQTWDGFVDGIIPNDQLNMRLIDEVFTITDETQHVSFPVKSLPFHYHHEEKMLVVDWEIIGNFDILMYQPKRSYTLALASKKPFEFQINIYKDFVYAVYSEYTVYDRLLTLEAIYNGKILFLNCNKDQIDVPYDYCGKLKEIYDRYGRFDHLQLVYYDADNNMYTDDNPSFAVIKAYGAITSTGFFGKISHNIPMEYYGENEYGTVKYYRGICTIRMNYKFSHILNGRVFFDVNEDIITSEGTIHRDYTDGTSRSGSGMYVCEFYDTVSHELSFVDSYYYRKAVEEANVDYITILKALSNLQSFDKNAEITWNRPMDDKELVTEQFEVSIVLSSGEEGANDANSSPNN